MKKSMGLMIALGLALVGCGGGAQYVVLNDGAMAREALASSDVHDTLCPVRGGTYSRGEWARPDERMRANGSPVVMDNVVPPQLGRSYKARPWLTKAPIAVRLDGEPVEIAVMDSGDAKVGMIYDAWPKEYSPASAYEKIRFLPCNDDPSEPTWFGWPGAIVADKRDICLKLAVREGDGDVSVLQVPLGNACPAGVD